MPTLSSHLDMEHFLEISRRYHVVSGQARTARPFSMVPVFQAKQPLTGHRVVVVTRALHPEILVARGTDIVTILFLTAVVESRSG